MADVETEPTKLGEAAPDEVIDKAIAESDRFFRKLDAALDRMVVQAQGAAHGEPIESGEAASDEEWNTRLSAAFGRIARGLASEMDKMTDEDSAESGQRQ